MLEKDVTRQYGRLKLRTDEKEITKENIEAVVSLAWAEHQHNAKREEWLIDYKKGDQPILDRVKKVRKDHNAKVVENNASKIVDFHKAYCFSQPITLVQRAKREVGKPEQAGEEDDLKISLLNKMMVEQGKPGKDIELAEDVFSCGLGYKMAIPIRDKLVRRGRCSAFEISVLNPLTTFMVYSNDAYDEEMLACTYNVRKDGKVDLTAYSENYCFELRAEKVSSLGTTNIADFKMVKKVTPNILGIIPIVEYSITDRMAIFEKVIPIMDAINLIDSDRVNDITQHVQSLLWMHNCQLDKEQKEQLVDGNGVVMTKSTGDGHEAKIVYLSQVLDQSEVQKEIDHLVSQLQEITSTPSWREASGGSTTGAMQLSNGWQCAELFAKVVEQQFNAAEQKFLDICIQIIKADERDFDGLKDIELADIEPHFCRTKTYDLVSKVNALVSLLNVGVDGLTAFNTVALFTDCQQAWIDSAPTILRLQENIGKTQTDMSWRASRDEQGNGGDNNTEKDITEETMSPSKVAEVDGV